MERAIIHLNIADFAAAIETCRAPALKGYPVVIAPLGAPRAVVYDMSETAYQEGIRKGMPLTRVRRINRSARIVPPSFNRYEMAMQDLLKQTRSITPLVESGITDGHLFLDVTRSGRLFGPPVDMAFRLRQTFKKHFGLDPIWSVATNKLVAKVATRMVKPVGEYIVGPGEEEAFLSPVPIGLIPGLEKIEIERLSAFNLSFVFQVKQLTLNQLKIAFQHRAMAIYDKIHGIDTAPVTRSGNATDMIQADHEFDDDTNDAGQLEGALYLMAESISRTLRTSRRQARQMRLILSYSDGLQATGRTRLQPGTTQDITLFKALRPVLEKTWRRRVRIRHMRLLCDKAGPAWIQAQLFDAQSENKHQKALIKTVDQIRDRFGKHAVLPALALTGKKPPVNMPVQEPHPRPLPPILAPGPGWDRPAHRPTAARTVA